MKQILKFKEYNEALKKNSLLGLTCENCGGVTCPPKMVCQECAGTDLSVTELSGKGTIVTFTTAFVAAEGKEAEAPYVIVVVELDEGPWIAGNLIDIDPSKTTMDLIGRKVTMGHKIFPGDRYSGGEAARPLFSFTE